MPKDSLIHGFHAIVSRLRRHAPSVKEIYLAVERQDRRAQDLAQLAEQHAVRVIAVDQRRIDGMTGGASHQGVAALVAPVVLKHHLDDILEDLTEPALLLVLDGVQDPHNLGACLRVADAAGVHAVIAPKDRAVGLTATVEKVAAGAAETVPYLMVTNLARTLRELKAQGVWLVGTDDQAQQSLFEAKLEGPLAWVMGAEGGGMRRLTQEQCDFTVRIPMLGSVESLNVSVASGICLFETRRQRTARSS